MAHGATENVPLNKFVSTFSVFALSKIINHVLRKNLPKPRHSPGWASEPSAREDSSGMTGLWGVFQTPCLSHHAYCHALSTMPFALCTMRLPLYAWLLCPLLYALCSMPSAPGPPLPALRSLYPPHRNPPIHRIRRRRGIPRIEGMRAVGFIMESVFASLEKDRAVEAAI